MVYELYEGEYVGVKNTASGRFSVDFRFVMYSLPHIVFVAVANKVQLIQFIYIAEERLHKFTHASRKHLSNNR